MFMKAVRTVMRIGKGEESLEWAESRMRQRSIFLQEEARSARRHLLTQQLHICQWWQPQKFVHQHFSGVCATKVITEELVLSLHADTQINSERGKIVLFVSVVTDDDI